jgi:hypothetical protein
MDRVKTGAKTRALKKYEAAPIAHATEQGDPCLELFCPFGPLIARAEVPQALVSRINRHADRLVPDDGGTEFLLSRDMVVEGDDHSLMRQTEDLIRRYLRLIDEPADSRINIDVFWIVSQRSGTPKPGAFSFVRHFRGSLPESAPTRS